MFDQPKDAPRGGHAEVILQHPSSLGAPIMNSMKHLILLLVTILAPLTLTAGDDALEAEWTAKLKEMGLDEHDLAWVLEQELKIQRRVAKVKEPEKREADNHKRHVKQGKKLISAYGFGKQTKAYQEGCAERWKEWWFLGKLARIAKLEEMFAAYEEEETDDRGGRGSRIASQLLDEMIVLNKKRHLAVTPHARSTFQETWHDLTHTPHRLHEERLKDAIVEVKRVGFCNEALKVFEKKAKELFSE